MLNGLARLPARKLDAISSFVEISSGGPNLFQKYARSGAVRIFFVNLWMYGSCLPRASIPRMRETLQISVPSRSALGKGRGGMMVFGTAVMVVPR